MNETTGNEDAWVVARIAALERANRQLWIGLGALAMTLVSVCLAALFLAASIELPSGSSALSGSASEGGLVVEDVTVRGSLRVVDEAGQSLIWIGRERTPAGAKAGPGQAVIGLFAGGSGADGSAAVPQQTVRLATSALGSALSMSTLDGSNSTSVFAGESGASIELRRGETSRLISEQPDGAPGARSRESRGKRSEAVMRAAADESDRGAIVDLSDPALQVVGDGFYVGQLSLSDQSGVLRVTGRLVNATSVDQLRAEFRLSVAGRDLPFSVGRIPAGSSTSFTVELPSANSSALRTSRLRWLRSTLSYGSD